MLTFVGYNHKEAGGVQLLIVNVLKALDEIGEQGKVVCDKESFIYKRLHELNVRFVLIDLDLIDINDLSLYITHDDTVILQDLALYFLVFLKKSNPQIIFYSVFPKILINVLKSLRLVNKSEFRTFILDLERNNALYFMDHSNYISLQEYYQLYLSPVKYIPVPVVSKLINFYKQKGSCSTITYIGRGSEIWKVYPVKKIVFDLIQLNFRGEFHIITDSISLFETMLAPLVDRSNILIKYKLGLYGESLDNYLIDNSDLHISMGTSALEGAKQGIPTLLIDISYNEFPDNYLYRWIFYENNYYNLGYMLDSSFVNKGATLKSILSLYETKKCISDISNKCFDYAKNNHSIEQTVNGFLLAMKQTTFRVNDFDQYGFFKYFKLSTKIKVKYPWIYSCVKFFR